MGDHNSQTWMHQNMVFDSRIIYATIKNLLAHEHASAHLKNQNAGGQLAIIYSATKDTCVMYNTGHCTEFSECQINHKPKTSP